jgi:hypothetical protein
MTSEERFERIEHVRAALVEERRKDREEYRQLWRDTQRQIDELSHKIGDTNTAITRLAEETESKINRLAEESREADRRLGERILTLVSAMGEYFTKQNPK